MSDVTLSLLLTSTVIFQMLSVQQKPVKQGWMLKKAGTGLLAPWKQKYVVVAARRDTDDMQLLIYDQRDISNPPKHRLILSDCRVDAIETSFKRLKKGAVPFTVHANSRKVNFVQR